jgi:hypothetical protein
MSQTFTPPTFDEQPRLEVTSRGSAARLFSYYPVHRVGRNIYKYADGTYTTVDPTGDLAPVVTYYGGHIYTVDDVEAAALAAAGFGANLSPGPNTVDVNPPARTFDPLGADISAGARFNDWRGYGISAYGEGEYGV